MKILLYIEPHPIRDMMVAFKDIARSFLPILSNHSDYDVRMFANKATFDSLGNELEDFKNKLIRTTNTEEEHLSDLLMHSWSNDGIPIWLDLMAGSGDVTKHQMEMLKRIWSEFSFQIIVHWGENGAVNHFVNEYPVTRVAMELGCTRPPFLDSLVIDPYGTNGSGIVPKMTVEDLRNIVENRSMSRHEAFYGFSNDISVPGYTMQFENSPLEISARSVGKKIAFLPLQLFDDANLKRFSPYKTLTDVVLDVVPRLCDAGYLTIIKPHPASKQRQGALIENEFARNALRQWSDTILWLDENSKLSNVYLLTRADLVVTVNSSVGFEALYFDNTVVVLGDAVYKPKDMFPSLDQILSHKFDRDAYLDAAGLLRRYMLGGYLQKRKVIKEPSVFCENLCFIHGFMQNSEPNPVGYAKGFWHFKSPLQQTIARSFVMYGASTIGFQNFRGYKVVTDKDKNKAETTDFLYQKNANKLPLENISRLKTFWLTEKTEQWIKDKWISDQGRYEVLEIGKIIDTDSITEGGSKPSNFHNISFDDVLSKLLSCAKQLKLNSYRRLSGVKVDPNVTKEFLAIFNRLQTHVSGLKIGSLSNWLSEVWHDQKKRAQVIIIGDVVDPNYYLKLHDDLKDSDVNPIQHYAFQGITEGRSPRSGVANAKALLALLQSNIKTFEAKQSNIVQPLTIASKNRRSKQLQTINEFISKTKNRIAVVAHLYYTDLVTEILDSLQNIKLPFDFFVTMPDWGTRHTKTMVLNSYPDAQFYNAENRGRDIGPFIDLLPLLIEKNYKAVLKLQTKRGYFRSSKMVPELGKIWRQETIDALLGSAERVDSVLDFISQNSYLNMVGPKPFLLSLKDYPYHDGGSLANGIIGTARADIRHFFAGSMFWVRPSCLKPLVKMNISNFGLESGANDGELAHLIERIFGELASTKDGMKAAAPVDPKEPLILEPGGNPLNIDKYLTQRANTLREEKRQQKEIGLFW